MRSLDARRIRAGCAHRDALQMLHGCAMDALRMRYGCAMDAFMMRAGCLHDACQMRHLMLGGWAPGARGSIIVESSRMRAGCAQEDFSGCALDAQKKINANFCWTHAGCAQENFNRWALDA